MLDVQTPSCFSHVSCSYFLIIAEVAIKRASALVKSLRYNCTKAKISSGNQKLSILYNTAMLTYFVTKNMTQHTFNTYLHTYIARICGFFIHIYIYIVYISIPYIFFTEIQNFAIVSLRIRVFNYKYLQEMAANLVV